MFETINYEDTLNINKTKIYIDCRSPLEFKLDNIPGSINIPILFDDEREKIGTLYKKGHIKEAKIEGVFLVSKRLPQIISQIIEIRASYENLYFYCARGGYRSSAIVNLLIGIGIKSYKLTKGYKGYREYINRNLESYLDGVNFITLYGYTGTGKTSILKEIYNLGYGILDLEKYANHRGSILGSIGKNEPFSQKKFESLLFNELKKYQGKYLFVEGESQRIGNIIMSKKLYNKLRQSKKILIKADVDFRINEIKNEYLLNFKGDKSLIKNTLYRLEKYISKEKLNKYMDLIDEDNYDIIIEDLCLNYYDKNYKLPKQEFEKEYLNKNSYETALKIVDDYKELFIK